MRIKANFLGLRNPAGKNMSIDRISNMLSSIKNASMTGNAFIEIPHSNVCEQVAEILKKKKFLENVKVFKGKGDSHQRLRLDIFYENGVSRITDVKRVSKPGRRVYKSSASFRKIAGGYGVSVVSTSRGILSSDEAKKRRLGGEVICIVW